MPKITLDTTRLLSVEFILMATVSLGSAYAAFSAWKADAEARMVVMEDQMKTSKADHDALIALISDVKAIRDDVGELKRAIIPQQKAEQ